MQLTYQQVLPAIRGNSFFVMHMKSRVAEVAWRNASKTLHVVNACRTKVLADISCKQWLMAVVHRLLVQPCACVRRRGVKIRPNRWLTLMQMSPSATGPCWCAQPSPSMQKLPQTPWVVGPPPLMSCSMCATTCQCPMWSQAPTQ